MTRELELAVNSGRIYAGMMKLAKEKQDFQKRVDEIYSNTRLSDEGKRKKRRVGKVDMIRCAEILKQICLKQSMNCKRL